MKSKKVIVSLLLTSAFILSTALPATAAKISQDNSFTQANSDDILVRKVREDVESGKIDYATPLPAITPFIAQHAIYGNSGTQGNFSGLNSVGVYSGAFLSDGGDLQINSYAHRDTTSTSGTYYITPYKFSDWSAAYTDKKTTASYPSTSTDSTYVYIWSGVGTGSYKALINTGSGDSYTISGHITVYAQN
ncbi:hypothetical protein [Paenibacillus aestuarii]|uniref:Uncharacterized protein n=1 Tax=Paenibacillus aestuarii TaxID=516965 RepID=A0ABW0K7T8_9BACL|nr:hypothetical protein [Paenibacillus aestuarii]